jgi:hypothetical protein
LQVELHFVAVVYINLRACRSSTSHPTTANMNESTYELLSFPDSFNDIISSTPSTLEQLSTFRAQLEWWFVLKPNTESFGKLSISICELLLSVPHGAFDPHEQKLAIECFRVRVHFLFFHCTEN